TNMTFVDDGGTATGFVGLAGCAGSCDIVGLARSRSGRFALRVCEACDDVAGAVARVANANGVANSDNPALAGLVAVAVSNEERSHDFDRLLRRAQTDALEPPSCGVIEALEAQR